MAAKRKDKLKAKLREYINGPDHEIALSSLRKFTREFAVSRNNYMWLRARANERIDALTSNVTEGAEVSPLITGYSKFLRDLENAAKKMAWYQRGRSPKKKLPSSEFDDGENAAQPNNTDDGSPVPVVVNEDGSPSTNLITPANSGLKEALMALAKERGAEVPTVELLLEVMDARHPFDPESDMSPLASSDQQAALTLLAEQMEFDQVCAGLQPTQVEEPTSDNPIPIPDSIHIGAAARRNRLMSEEIENGNIRTVDDQIRWAAKTNLFFLCHLLGKSACNLPHRIWCDALFLQLDPRKTIASQSEIKKRMLCSSRGSWKSTINLVSLVQFLLCFPNARILLLCGGANLSKKLLAETRNYFLVSDDDDTSNRSLFQNLFPRYCTNFKDRGSSASFTLMRARTQFLKDGSVYVSSAGSSPVGFRADMISSDDMEDDTNCSRPELVEATNAKFFMALKLLQPGRYCQVLATPFHEGDLTEKLRELKWSCVFSACYHRLKSAEGKAEVQLEPTDVKLSFPQVLTWEHLRENLFLDWKSFRLSFLLSLRDETEEDDKFSEADIDAATITDLAGLPQSFDSCFNVWDTASTVSASSDFSAGVTVGIKDSVIYVLKITHIKAVGAELANQIADLGISYRAYSLIESSGAGHLEDAIGRAFSLRGVLNAYQHFSMFKISTGPHSKGSKNKRIMALNWYLRNQQLKFLDCENLDELKRQLLEAHRKSTNRKNDICDALASVPEQVSIVRRDGTAFPNTSGERMLNPEPPRTADQIWRDAQDSDSWLRLYPEAPIEDPFQSAENMNEPPPEIFDPFAVPGFPSP